MPDRLTLDTNLPMAFWKQEPERSVVERLVALAEAGEVDLAVTRYIRDDVTAEPHASRINDLATELQVIETPGVFTFSVSRLGGSDGLGSQELLDFRDALGPNWKPRRGKTPDERDWLHLHAHFIQKRDVFLTWDWGLRDLARELAAAAFAIRVMKPEDYLASRSVPQLDTKA